MLPEHRAAYLALLRAFPFTLLAGFAAIGVCVVLDLPPSIAVLATMLAAFGTNLMLTRHERRAVREAARLRREARR